MQRKLRAADADARNRQARGDRRRQEILDAAVDLFAARGYRNTGVLTLAERVGLSDTGLLYYFGSKERLLHEVVAERPQVRFPVSDDELTLAELRVLGRRYADERTLTRLYLVLAAENLNDDDPLHEFFVRRYQRGVDFIRDVLEHDRRRGNVRADVDLEQIATEILATELGLELLWLMDPDGIDIASIREAHIDHLVEDLAPPSPTRRRVPPPVANPEARAALDTGATTQIADPDVEELDIGGVTVYAVMPAGVDSADERMVLDLHGGGFIEGGARCRAAAAITASRLGMKLWAVDHRMPPDHPHPAPLDDALAAYRELVRRVGADKIVVHGTSSGGNLAAALVLRARDDALPLPGALVLLSPHVAFTESGDTDLADPYVSPLFGDFTGFPPVFVASGIRDLVLSSAVRLHQRLRAADVPADLYLLETGTHGGFFGSTPESDELTRQVRRFIDEHVRPADL